MYRMRILLVSTALLSVALLAAACGGADPTPAECFAPDGGVLVPVPCDDGGGPVDTPTPTATSSDVPTATPTESNGGGSQLERGKRVFLQAAPLACATCHSIDGLPGAVGQIGPNLSQIGAKGGAYLRESIVDPNAVIAEECPGGAPCQPDVMIQTYGTDLSVDGIDALVAYLSTLQ